MRENPETLLGSNRRAAEITRQSIHIITGLWAYLLRWVTPGPLMLLTLVATAFNLWMLPRVCGRWLWREHEMAAGRAVGIVLYPLTVFLLLGLFYRRPEVAAAGWGLLAFADGAATLAGRQWGKRCLPWSAGKTWAGFLGYTLAGWVAVF